MKPSIITKLSLITFAAMLTIHSTTEARDYYVSAAKGKGKKATKEKPAKDMGNIISRLVPGDRVHIAGGTYLGRGANGSDIIKVPVSILGGYDETFSKRDPWGATKTIFSGDNLSENWEGTPRLMIDLMQYRGKEMPAITVDGLIIDDAARNRYKTDEHHELLRKANPKTKQNPTPGQGALVVRVSKTGNFDAHWEIEVKNCVVMNHGASQGALSVSGYQGSRIRIHNNLVINNTGSGIYAGTKFRGAKDRAQFDIRNNTVLFTWKFDPGAQSYSGNAFKADSDVVANLENNVLGFSDRYGIQNAGKSILLVRNNSILGNVLADYQEFDTNIDLEDIEDEAEFLHEDSEENVADPIKVPLSEAWAKLYASRVLVDRNAAEADIKVAATAANELRSILGLPLQAGTVDRPESPVWLPRIGLDDAISAGTNHYLGDKGSTLPEL